MSKDREKSNLQEKVLHINRCSKVVKGGRKFSFSALVVAGDGQGRVGFALAKANELSDSIRKGGESAKKNLIKFERQGDSIPHEINTYWDGTTVIMKPAPVGTGVIAGSAIRSVLELAGIKDVVTKLYGSNNRLNQVRAVMRALGNLKNREHIRKLRRRNS